VNRWLRTWSLATVLATAVLLFVGALVTSFRVGMADPVWPTEPWRMALIDWSEPSAGFLIEHSHRLAGFIVGGMISVLAIGVWATEPRRGLRWGGIASIIGLLAAFGYLHGVLIRQTKTLSPGSRLTVPPEVAGVLVLALAAVIGCCLVSALWRYDGWGTRVLTVGLLAAVMIQGLFGGMRVYFNALFGPEFAVVHGAFAQVVFGLAVVVMMLTRGCVPKATLVSWLAVSILYAQVAFGVYLRQMLTPLGARLHLVTAFVATAALLASMRQSWIMDRSRWKIITPIVLLAAQVLLGVEAWLHRFGGGFPAAEFMPITLADALLRTAHAVVGYMLFSKAIMLAFSKKPIASVTSPRRWPALEGVA